MASFLFFAAVSADGYLAGPDGDMAWAEKYLEGGEDYGFADLMNHSVAVLEGSKTFDFELNALGDQARMLPTFVLTSNPMKYDGLTDPNVHFVSGPIAQVVAEINRKIQGQVFVVGGADVVRQLMQVGLLDQLTLFISPDVLGGGVPLFETSLEEALTGFEIASTKDFESGLSQRDYRVVR